MMGRVKKAVLSGRGAELQRAYRKQDLTGRGQGGAVQAGDRRAPWGPSVGCPPYLLTRQPSIVTQGNTGATRSGV